MNKLKVYRAIAIGLFIGLVVAIVVLKDKEKEVALQYEKGWHTGFGVAFDTFNLMLFDVVERSKVDTMNNVVIMDDVDTFRLYKKRSIISE